MAPIVKSPSVGALKQGDILREVCRIVHTDDGAKKTDFPYAVVLSRDCKALRSKDILVAGIKPYQTGEILNALKSDGFERIKTAFSKIRDGDGSPDSCYIGTIEENDSKRFAIQLDAIFTVRVVVPREEWIQRKRVMSLNFSMVRHLQSRLFASFTRQGFDDVSWWPTKDLELAVNHGEAELLQLQTQ